MKWMFGRAELGLGRISHMADAESLGFLGRVRTMRRTSRRPRPEGIEH